MNTSIKIKRRRRKGSVSFEPDRQYIETAVSDFLKNGGKIEQLTPDESSFQNSMTRHDGSLDADEFLLDA